jgi:endoglucanase
MGIPFRSTPAARTLPNIDIFTESDIEERLRMTSPYNQRRWVKWIPSTILLAVLLANPLLSYVVQHAELQLIDPRTANHPLHGKNIIRQALKGVNLAGNDGYLGKNSRASAKGLNYYLSRGMNTYRLMERWESLQPELGGPLDKAALVGLDFVVNLITSAGAYAIIDAHQGGRRKIGGDHGDTYIIGQDPQVTSDHFAEFWSKLAMHYAGKSNIIFNLQNEPHDQDTNKLVETYNKAIDAIRKTGATNMILIDGNTYTGGGGSNFFAPYDGSVANSIALINITDPQNHTVIDIHQYFDGRNGGTMQSCEPGSGSFALNTVTEWARSQKKQLFFGEFGFGANKVCYQEVCKVLNFIEKNADVWVGWAYFAAYAGADPYNKPDTFWYNIDPTDFENPTDDPRMDVLKKFLSVSKLIPCVDIR